MTRMLATLVTAALLAMTGGAHAAPPFFLAYARPAGTATPCDLGTTNPANFQGGNPNLTPVLPPTEIPLGVQTTLDLCYLVWPPADSPTTQVVCQDGAGTESCAERLRFSTNGGITINAFTPVASPTGGGFPEYEATLAGATLVVMGGDPVAGRQGAGTVGRRVGTVTLTGISATGTFELSQASYVNASMQRIPAPATLIATALSTCGDFVVDPGEDCDDGNETWGDACAPGCSFEDGFALQGQAGTSGTLFVEIDGVGISLDLSTLPNAPADEVILAMVARVNADATLIASAAQVDDTLQAGANDGKRLVTNGTVTAGPTLVTQGGTIAVPEPGLWPMLASGVAFLLGAARRRARIRH